jgi:hypothetical protein
MKTTMLLAILATSLNGAKLIPAQGIASPAPPSKCIRFLNFINESNNEKRLAKIDDLHYGGRESIRTLIAVINDGASTSVDLLNPIGSYIPPTHRSGLPCGAVAAYLVEFILGRYGFHSISSPFFLGNDPDNYVYQYGDLIETRSGKNVSSGDLVGVKAAYTIWWNKNSGKSLEELRKDWLNGSRPLSHSFFAWR